MTEKKNVKAEDISSKMNNFIDNYSDNDYFDKISKEVTLALKNFLENYDFKNEKE